MLTIQLSNEWESLLQQFAKEAGKNSEDYARDIVIEYLADMEDAHIAEQRLRDIRSGKETTVSLQEVMKEYGMDAEV